MRGVIRTAFERESLVAACRASGLSPNAFAEREHLPPSTVYQWLTKQPRQKPVVRIARVIGRADSPRESAAPEPTASPIVVEVGAARVRVAAGFDRRLLAELFDLLESRCRNEPS